MPLFARKKDVKSAVSTDIHNHILPGLDDGAKDLESSKELIIGMKKLGINRFVVTPHVMSDYYKNTPDDIHRRGDELREYLQKEGVEAEIIDGGEYYLDEVFAAAVKDKEELISFGKEKYVLVETGFMNKPQILRQTFFELMSRGFKPIFAHPERYGYVYEDSSLLQELMRQGVHFQLNLNSIIGYYGPQAKKLAERLIKAEAVQFIGSDCHHHRHVEAYAKSLRHKSYQKLAALPLQNDQI